MNVKMNDTLNNLFNAAYGSTVLDAAVQGSKTAVTREHAVIVLAAGYIAGDKGYTPKQATSNLTALLEQAEYIMANSSKPNSNSSKPNRTAAQERTYMKANAKYLFYFGTGASSKAGKKASSNRTDMKADIVAASKRAIKRYNKATLRAYIALLQAAL